MRRAAAARRESASAFRKPRNERSRVRYHRGLSLNTPAAHAMIFSNFTLGAMLLAGGLFLALVACLEIGRRVGVRRAARDGEAARAGAGVVEGAVFALLGLLVAFTFSGAAARFDQRRALIVEEANAIGTAYLRLDLLPAAAREELRESFRRYVDARLAVSTARCRTWPRSTPRSRARRHCSRRSGRGRSPPRRDRRRACWCCRPSIR
jgi:hypothetical protein